MPMSSKIKRVAATLLKLLIAFVIAYFIFRKLNASLSETAKALAHANFPLMSLGILLIILALLIVMVVWRKILSDIYGFKLSVPQALILQSMPNIAKYIPGKIWFIFAQVYLAKEFGVNSVSIVVTTLISQMILITSAIFAGFLLVDFAKTPLFSIWGVIFLVVLIVILLKPRILHKIIELGLKIMKKKLEVKPPKMKLWTLLYSLVVCVAVWIIIGLGITMCSASVFGFNMYSNTPEITGAFCISYVVGYISFFAPAGIGIREGVMALLLPGNLSTLQSSVISIGSRLWITIAEIIFYGFIILLYLRMGISKKATISLDKTKN